MTDGEDTAAKILHVIGFLVHCNRQFLYHWTPLSLILALNLNNSCYAELIFSSNTGEPGLKSHLPHKVRAIFCIHGPFNKGHDWARHETKL